MMHEFFKNMQYAVFDTPRGRVRGGCAWDSHGIRHVVNPYSISKKKIGFAYPNFGYAYPGLDTRAPHLRSIDVRLLGQVSSSSCCERNWSTYAFIHSTKRNQITLERAEDLIYVHNNLRLLSRKAQPYMKGESKMWDVAGDAFDSMDDVGILGIANLSLDEPELESVLFCDEGEGPNNDDDHPIHFDA
ncbi:hypothetical protein ACS0TY_006219 [Phlomoides rotata]